MGLDLLDTPVRVTWDFPSEAPTDPDRWLEIATRIAEAGVFFVTLQGAPLLHESLGGLLKTLSGSQCLLNCYGSDRELVALDNLGSFNGQVQYEITTPVSSAGSFDPASVSGTVETLRVSGFEPVLAMTPLRHNLVLIPTLIDLCLEQKISKFKLPNAHIGDSFHGDSAEDLPDWKDLREFSKLWSETLSGFDALPRLEIHDLFLWEIMTPGLQQSRSEYGGCQAANSLAHVDTDGTVHPCAAWPCSLGSLPGESLEDIWAGPLRKSICDKIAQTPDGCLGCQDLGICFGGCRGLAHTLNRVNGERDLMCPGPR